MITAIRRRLRNEKGVTLVELLVVVVILGIIAAIAIPSVGNIVENTRYNAAKADAITVLNAANLYFADTPTESSVTVATLKSSGFLQNAGKVPDTASVTKASSGENTISTASSASITFSGSKTLTLNAATITHINNDQRKGSSLSSFTIPPASGS